MKKTFKYCIKANKIVIQNTEDWLGLCRKLYNNCLEEKINVYKEQGKSISCYTQMKKLPSLKKELAEYKKVNSQTLQDVIQRLDRAYQNFFRRVKRGEKPGFPRFKGRDRYDSFTLKQTGYSLRGRYLFIKNIGRFKIFLSRPIEGDIKTVTIHRSSSGKWFASFSCDNVSTQPLPKTGRSIGIDVGCEHFLTASNGKKVDNPRFYQRAQSLLAQRQKRLSRKKKGSNRRNKMRILVAKAYEKVFNQRRDFHFKVADKLLKANDIICIEDMNHFNSFRVLNRSMRDVAWFDFFNILAFKAAEAGKQVIKVPAKNTSQVCSNCGRIVSKTLSDRVHHCPYCSLVLDRDINAARNILRLGQSLQGAASLEAAVN